MPSLFGPGVWVCCLLLIVATIAGGGEAFSSMTNVAPFGVKSTTLLQQQSPLKLLSRKPSILSYHHQAIFPLAATIGGNSAKNDGSEQPQQSNNTRQDTPAKRMRRRKVKIYNQRKTRATAFLFGLWYTLSVAYNIFSKRVLNMAPELAWTAAWAQMAGGLLYVLPVWMCGLRAPPQVSSKDMRQKLLPVALLHSLVHVGGIISMGAGAVSFTYIVKATEPAVSAGLAALLLKSFLPLPVYLTLIPVIAGVSLASVSELSFSWKAFLYAMMSNLASASRGIVSKKTMSHKVGKNLTPMNLYAVLTVLATMILFPVATILEGSQWTSSLKRLQQAGQLTSYLLQTLLGALTYYLYNEVSFMALDNISPVSHALASTLRRVFIITSSMLVFGNQMTPLGILGSVMAVGGALLYSAAKHHYKQQQQKSVS